MTALRFRRNRPTTGAEIQAEDGPILGGHGAAMEPGTVLEDRYEVLRVIGHGGMSTVYLAKDLRFRHVERLCAVKEMVNRDRNDQTRLLRFANFEREAAILATLNHPAIPKIYDYFAIGGLIYLVLEYIDGEDLERLISRREQPLPEDTLIDWSLQILDVVAYLHEHQPEPLVFRDLKPSNIMLRRDGAISLIDFGIARTFQPLQRGTMIGTEGYAPPEQYRGIAEPRGDIYALGATLHHLATRSDPRSEPPFSFAQRLPRDLNPELSEDFQSVILRALAYAPADRFPSAAAMAQAIIDIQQRRSQPPPDEPAVIEPSRARQDGSPPGAGPTDAAGAPAAAAEGEAIADRVAWSIQTSDEVRGTPAVGDGFAYVGSYDQHLYAVRVADGGIVWRFHAHRGIVSRPALVGDMVIVGAEDYSIYGLRASTGRLVWSLRTAMPVRSSAAAYGDVIVIGSDDGYCYCVDAAQGQLIWRYRAWGPIRSSPLVSGDDIIVGSDDGSVHCFSAVDGRPVWRSPLGAPVLSSPARAGELIVVGCLDGQIYALAAASGARRWAVRTQGPVIASPRVYRDLVVVGSTDGAVHALAVADGERRWRSQIANQITASVALDGSHGIVGTIDGNVFCLDLATGETAWSLRVGSGIVSTPAVDDGIAVIGTLKGRIVGLRI